MKFTLANAALLTSIVVAAPQVSSKKASRAVTDTNSLTFFNGTCTEENVTTRVEWRNLTSAQRIAYTTAELCLMDLPAQTTLNGVTSRFSDLQSLHRSKTNTAVGDIIHNVSEMWNSIDGIGGNGTGVDNCVVDGPFANRTEHIGPLLEDTDYCLGRAWTNDLLDDINTAAVEVCTANNAYYDFFNCMVAYPDGPHVAGHTSVGSLMADIDASPGDPSFFIHHVYIDRMWWQWQQANASSRLYDMSGNSVNLTLASNIANEPVGGWPNTTLTYEIDVADILPSVDIATVMNIQGGCLCYQYDY